MLVRHFVDGRPCWIEAPDGSKVVRRSDQMTHSGEFLSDYLLVPWEGQSYRIFAEPPGVIPLLAGEGLYGLRMLGTAMAAPLATGESAGR